MSEKLYLVRFSDSWTPIATIPCAMEQVAREQVADDFKLCIDDIEAVEILPLGRYQWYAPWRYE